MVKFYKNVDSSPFYLYFRERNKNKNLNTNGLDIRLKVL